MTVRSWMVRAWPQVAWCPPQDRSAWPFFHHMGTEVRSERDEYGRAVGDTVWAASMGSKGLLGAAWEWVELLPGVVVLSDPNGLVSNAQFLADDGAEECELRSTVMVNCIAHSIPWQRTVTRLLQHGGSDVIVNERSYDADGSWLRGGVAGMLARAEVSTGWGAP